MTRSDYEAVPISIFCFHHIPQSSPSGCTVYKLCVFSTGQHRNISRRPFEWRVNILQSFTATKLLGGWGGSCTNYGGPRTDYVAYIFLSLSLISYSALLEGTVKKAIRNKRKRVQTSVSFLQDNARPHVAARSMDNIQKLKWNDLSHPPYSPDLAPSDYHLFDPLKEHLGGKGFRNNEEVIQNVHTGNQKTSS